MNLDRAILEALDAAERGAPGRPIPFEVIRGAVRGFVAKTPTPNELEAELNALAKLGHVKGVNTTDNGTVWNVTAAGKLRLAE